MVSGCGSLTEIAQAEEMGCELVKLFLEAPMVQALLRQLKGHNHGLQSCQQVVFQQKSNLRGWFEAGVTCVGIGSKLISKEILANKNYTTLKENVASTLALIQKIK